MAEYTQEQREQAAVVLESHLEENRPKPLYGPVPHTHPDPLEMAKEWKAHEERNQSAYRVAIDALRSSGWLDTTTDKPTDPHETVIVQDENGQVYTAPGWIVRDFPGTHPRWMRLPKVPGSDARKAPEEAEG